MKSNIPDLLKNHKEAIAALGRKYSVQRLFAFGSASRADFQRGESDGDLLVDFAPMGGHAPFHAYVEMLNELQSVSCAKVDPVMNDAVCKARIKCEIEQTKG